jgi:hypothetical protein
MVACENLGWREADDMNTLEIDPVRSHTRPDMLERIDSHIEERIRFYATQPKEAISKRIEELEREWDIQRCLETNYASFALTGLLLGTIAGRKWLLLAGAALGLMLQHAVQGYSPPVALLRRAGVRTRGEIDREKYALKILRGDFQAISTNPDELRRNPLTEVWKVVST